MEGDSPPVRRNCPSLEMGRESLGVPSVDRGVQPSTGVAWSWESVPEVSALREVTW